MKIGKGSFINSTSYKVVIENDIIYETSIKFIFNKTVL